MPPSRLPAGPPGTRRGARPELRRPNNSRPRNFVPSSAIFHPNLARNDRFRPIFLQLRAMFAPLPHHAWHQFTFGPKRSLRHGAIKSATLAQTCEKTPQRHSPPIPNRTSNPGRRRLHGHRAESSQHRGYFSGRIIPVGGPFLCEESRGAAHSDTKHPGVRLTPTRIIAGCGSPEADRPTAHRRQPRARLSAWSMWR